MSTDALDNLLGKLSSGDDAAAEEVFRTYEPYLRVIVRRMLPPPMRSKFDSVDVVQSVWADVLRGSPTTISERGVHSFHRYLVRTFADDRPMDAFARELLKGIPLTETINAPSQVHIAMSRYKVCNG